MTTNFADHKNKFQKCYNSSIVIYPYKPKVYTRFVTYI